MSHATARPGSSTLLGSVHADVRWLLGAVDSVGTSLAELQREATIRTLRATGGNRRRAAKILGISPNTLYKALAKYGVEPNHFDLCPGGQIYAKFPKYWFQT